MVGNQDFLCSFIVVSLLLARLSFFKSGMQDPFKRFRQAFFNLWPEVCNLWCVGYPKIGFLGRYPAKLIRKNELNTNWTWIFFIFAQIFAKFYEFKIWVPNRRYRPITNSMYLALFSFHLSPKLAITLSMLPEAGAISYFDWFRTLNRLELSADDMYDTGFWASIGPCQLFVYLTTFLMNGIYSTQSFKKSIMWKSKWLLQMQN